MKKTISVAIVAICLLATNFSVHAQKVFRPSKTAIDVNKPVRTRPILIDVNAPKQDPNLAKIKGTITIESDLVFKFSSSANDERIFLIEVEPSTATSAGGLIANGFKFRQLLQFDANTVLSKIDDKHYNFTFYNVPLMKAYIIAVFPSHQSNELIKTVDIIGGYNAIGVNEKFIPTAYLDVNTAGTVNNKAIVIKNRILPN